jgi:hypothetical protein
MQNGYNAWMSKKFIFIALLIAVLTQEPIYTLTLENNELLFSYNVYKEWR